MTTVTDQHRRTRSGKIIATCPFADAVYSAAEDAGKRLGASQTEGCRYCLSAFLLTSSPGAKPEVVALGSGEH